MTTSKTELLLAAKLFLEIAADRLHESAEALETEQYIHAAHSYIQAAAYGTDPDAEAQGLFAAIVAGAAVQQAARDPSLVSVQPKRLQKA